MNQRGTMNQISTFARSPDGQVILGAAVVGLLGKLSAQQIVVGAAVAAVAARFARGLTGPQLVKLPDTTGEG